MLHKVDYEPIEKILERSATKFEDNHSGSFTFNDDVKTSYILGALKAAYEILCIRIDVHNDLFHSK